LKFFSQITAAFSKCKHYAHIRGTLSCGAHPWIDPRYGFAPLLNTWTQGCTPRFHGLIQHFAHMTSVT